jgi:hypothetical protein
MSPNAYVTTSPSLSVILYTSVIPNFFRNLKIDTVKGGMLK